MTSNRQAAQRWAIVAGGEPDVAKRRETQRCCYEDGATYTDPNVHLHNAEELVAHITSVLLRRPGATVIRTSAVDEHHDIARFNWRVLAADGATLRDGIDIAEFSVNGLLRRIVGFVGVGIGIGG